MKKAIIVFLIATVALTFVACPKGDTQKGGTSIGVTIYRYDDTFMSYTRNAIESNAAGKASLEVVDSQNQQPLQNDQVDAFIARGVSALAINTVDRTASNVIADKAKAANIPIVFFNREPMPEVMNSWDKIYYVGAKAEESGTMQGEIAYDYIQANPDVLGSDGVLQYVMLRGEVAHQDAELRREFAIKYLTNKGIKVECLVEDHAMWQRPLAADMMTSWYSQYGDRIEMVFANNDDMALGAIEALRQAGFFQGGKYMPVLGVDATPPALQAIGEGTLLGTVLNDADNQGKATFDIAYALGTGATPTSSAGSMDGKYCWVPYQKVTKDNYTQYQ